MQGYTRKILFISALVYAIFPLGFLPAILYSMSNTPAQMRHFALLGVLVWVGVFLLGLLMTYFIAKPVQDFLDRMGDSTSFAAEELMTIAKRNKQMPMVLGLLVMIMFSIMEISLNATYRRTGVSPLSPLAIFFTLGAGALVTYMCLSGTLSFVVSPVYDFFYRACLENGIPFAHKGSGLGLGIMIPLVGYAIAVFLWLMIPAFYEGIFRVREEVGRSMLAGQNIALKDLLDSKGGSPAQDDLKLLVDRMDSSGMGSSFLVNSHGEMLYNPAGIDIYNRHWQDINTALRKAFSSGKPGSLYENVHEQVVCYTPVAPGMVLGTVAKMSDRRPDFKQFWLVYALMGLAVFLVVWYVGIAMVISIVKPIARTKMKIHDLSAGEGDLTSRLEVLSDNESGAMAAEFNAFVAKLEEIVSAVRRTAYEVNASTQEVAAGSMGLSQATQDQAASIEEVASTIEEMTSTIKLMPRMPRLGARR
ncbi:MAG TPA: methyl-accepting chemotaxis protein [Deltaproteobacteria bacterium]|nr:methyl-accepting chemotaxis protein [Deltaproteobacteria bacterium]